jgi:hypothetical protein
MTLQIFANLALKTVQSSGDTAGLPDFSWYTIQKTEKNAPIEHKMYEMVRKYPKSS